MKKADKTLITLAVIYIVLPVILFACGWLRLPLALVVVAGLLWLAINIIKKFEFTGSISITENSRFWIISLIVIAVWVLLSGIGGFGYQTGDFIARNPMYRDLEIYSWPVIYDMSGESEQFLQFVNGANNALYIYYFTWWLPAALLTKLIMLITGLGYVDVIIFSNTILYIWAVLGVFLTFYCLVGYFKRYSYWILSSFVLFGGFDFVIYVFRNCRLPINEHIEWWAGGVCAYFQYSANTTQLYWVFNQSIPVWLIMAMFLVMQNRRVKAGWCSLCFAYSPFATIGIIPFAIAGSIAKDKKGIKDKVISAVSISNIMVPICMFISYGFFYLLQITGDKVDFGIPTGFIFSIFPGQRTFSLYVLFILFEVGIYLMIMGRSVRKYSYFPITIVELILLPLYREGMYSDFTMRASIPALFMLMIMTLQYLFEMQDKGNVASKRIIMVALIIGYMTSVTEIQRNFSQTVSSADNEFVDTAVYSFGEHRSCEASQCLIDLNQYMTLDKVYEDSIFYKYIMRK